LNLNIKLPNILNHDYINSVDQDNEISEREIYGIIEIIDNFYKSNFEKYQNYVLINLKILIISKILKKKNRINLHFQKIEYSQEIKENAEAIIFAVIYSNTITSLKIGIYDFDKNLNENKNINFSFFSQKDHNNLNNALPILDNIYKNQNNQKLKLCQESNSNIQQEELEKYNFFNFFHYLFQYNKSIKTLILEGNVIVSEMLERLKHAMELTKNIEEVHINFSGFVMDDSIKGCFESLIENSTIKRFHLKISIFSLLNNEKINFFTNAYLECGKLLKLNVYQSFMNSRCENIYEILRYKNNIQKLKMRFDHLMQICVEKICDSLKNNHNLIELDLSHNNMDDDCIKVLCEKYLKLNKKIKIINLDNNNFGDKGLIILVDTLLENEDLFEIDISWNDYSDVGMLYLKKFIINSKSLEKVYISKNRLTEEGIKNINEAFNINKNIKKIMIGMNDISR